MRFQTTNCFFINLFFKALEDEDCDTENIEIPLTADTSTRKDGKVKGNLILTLIVETGWLKSQYFFLNVDL